LAWLSSYGQKLSFGGAQLQLRRPEQLVYNPAAGRYSADGIRQWLKPVEFVAEVRHG